MVRSIGTFLQLINGVLHCLSPYHYDDIFIKPGSEDTFDYVIVGGGSAGSVIAKRLSENEKYSVLLIEAGDKEDGISIIPAIFPALLGSDIDWKYRSEPGDYCKGWKDERCNVPRGKVLGGSSSINAMLYVVPNERDYIKMSNNGKNCWTWNTFKKYYKKASIETNSEDGYLNGEVYEYKSKWSDYIIEAGRANGGNYYKTKSTIIKGKRVSAATLYLRPHPTKNLHIMLKTIANKVIIKNNVAKGVEVEFKGNDYKIKARKEVILTAGAIGTPQILMLSGIGPKKHLNDLGIECIKDLPVGKNLQDHYILPIAINVDSNPFSLDVASYCLLQKGYLAGTQILQAMGFVNTKSNSKYPDIQYHHFYLPKLNPEIMELFIKMYGFREEEAMNLREKNLLGNLIIVEPTLLNPKSKGEILLSSKSIYDHPKIYLNYLKEQEDIDTLMRGIKYALNVFQTHPFHNNTVFHYDKRFCDHKDDFHKFWTCTAKHFGSTIYHQCGTCTMGDANDSKTVVDQFGRVLGIDNLRVGDASIMSHIPSGNTNIPVIINAEIIADMIKGIFKCE